MWISSKWYVSIFGTKYILSLGLHLFQLGSGILDQIGLIISLKGDDSSSTDPITGYSTILYNGTFNPQPDFANPQNGFHENFTLAVPENYVVTGPATLTVLHFLATDVRIPFPLFYLRTYMRLFQAALTPEVEIVDTQFILQ